MLYLPVYKHLLAETRTLTLSRDQGKSSLLLVPLAGLNVSPLSFGSGGGLSASGLNAEHNSCSGGRDKSDFFKAILCPRVLQLAIGFASPEKWRKFLPASNPPRHLSQRISTCGSILTQDPELDMVLNTDRGYNGQFLKLQPSISERKTAPRSCNCCLKAGRQ